MSSPVALITTGALYSFQAYVPFAISEAETFVSETKYITDDVSARPLNVSSASRISI